MAKRKVLTVVLCAVIVCFGLFLWPSFRAQAADSWVVRGNGIEYTLTQEDADVTIDSFSDAVPGTLRGACYYDRFIYVLTEQDGELLFSACNCIPHIVLTVSLTAAFDAPLPGNAFDFAMHEGDLFTYTAADGETVGFHYASGSVEQVDTWGEETLGSIAEPEDREPPEGLTSSAVSTDPAQPDRGSFYFPEPVTVDGAKVQYFRETGGQAADAEFAVYTAEGVQMQSGSVATGCYLVETRNGELYAYCVAVVLGDLTSSGRPDEDSYELLRAYLLSENDSLLSSLARQAADMNGDGEITVADLLLLKRAM